MSNNPGLNLAARARWQKWEMDNLNSRKKKVTLPKPDNGLKKAAELKQQQAIIEQAKKDGFEEGYKKGLEQGYEAGKSQGWQTGTEEGYEDGRQNGHQDGYARGLAEGTATGNEQAGQTIAQINQLVKGFNTTLNNLEQEIGQSVIKLSIDIARQIIRTQLKEHPEHINAVIQEALESNPEQENILRIHLNPADIKLVKQHRQTTDAEQQYRLVEQADISPGGCIIDTEHGSIDATLETRWLRIIGALGYANEY